ncbi:MAG TPA: glycosyltransferase family 9 protein [Verrucomicrobiae bacterium]|nr:glycosyltransferase family 9 protein [Verrucomicrobiae bacterium]
MSSLRGKILVIRGGAIGDFILTLPAIAALRKQFPDAHLEVLGYPHIIQLAEAGGLVDKISSIEARQLAGFFARQGELAEELVDYFSEFDLILSYLYDPDQIFRTNVGRCSPAQFIACPHRPDERAELPAAVAYLKPLERLAIFEADPVPRLRIDPRPLFDANSVLAPGQAIPAESPGQPAPRLALHPGSGGERKNWPEHSWAELLQRLVNLTRFDLLLVGGEAEGERLQRLAAALPPARTRVAQSLPLADLARILGRCHGFVGHDSGISHLAAAVGLPGLVLWGATNQAVWRPPSEKVTILRHPAGLDALSAQTVFENILRLWPV